MFKKAPDDRFYTNIFGKARDTGPQAADSPHDQINGYAGAAGLIKLLDHGRIDQRVEFRPDARLFAGALVRNFLVDQFKQ